jgi:hypothetical protein
MIFCSLVAGGAGGMAGGAMMALWPIYAPWIAKGVTLKAFFGFLPIALSAAFFFAIFGAAFGVIFGFLPAFAAGTALTAMSRWRPFQLLIVWMLAGAGTGFAVVSLFSWRQPLDSTPAWVFGGTAAMMTYWGLGLRVFKLGLKPASSTQA